MEKNKREKSEGNRALLAHCLHHLQERPVIQNRTSAGWASAAKLTQSWQHVAVRQSLLKHINVHRRENVCAASWICCQVSGYVQHPNQQERNDVQQKLASLFISAFHSKIRPVTFFFFYKLIELDAGTGEAICNTLLQYLNKKSLHWPDGDTLHEPQAGSWSMTQSKKKNHSRKSLPDVHWLVCIFFSQSPKLMRELEAVAPELGIWERRVGRVFNIRWLSSSCTSVTALWKSYSALVQLFWHLSEDNTRLTKEKAKCAGMHAMMTQWLFVCFRWRMWKMYSKPWGPCLCFYREEMLQKSRQKQKLTSHWNHWNPWFKWNGVNTNSLKEENAKTRIFKGLKMSEGSETQLIHLAVWWRGLCFARVNRVLLACEVLAGSWLHIQGSWNWCEGLWADKTPRCCRTGDTSSQ